MNSRTRINYLLVVAAFWCVSQLGAAVAVLELERSTDLQTWEKVTLDPTVLTATGGLLQDGHDPKAFYRLRIHDDRDAGFITAVLLENAPRTALSIAQQFLQDALLEDEESEGGDPEGVWEDVQLGPVCYPIYDPAVEDGKTPAYLEFKIIRKPLPSPDPKSNDPFGLSPPITYGDICDSGHLLVALTQGDLPVPTFAHGGPTPVEMLLRRSRTSGPIKPLRFDDGLLVAEDADGNLVGSLGAEPFYIDPEILKIAGREFGGFADERGEEQDDAPEFEIKPYESYRAFKEDFVRNPLFVQLRQWRAELAREEWDLVLGVEPASVQIPLQETVLLFEERFLEAAVVEDPEIAEVTVNIGRPGLLATGLRTGGTLLEVVYQDGAREKFVLLVGRTQGAGAGPDLELSGWTSWKYWYAGNWNDQRRYAQFSNDSQMCPNGWSGCGPTAWAMLYGWWDRKGSPRLMKNPALGDAPLVNDRSVRDCTRHVFNQLGPFCVNSQAATMPWNMYKGHRWANHRGAGYSISWQWGLPYASPGSRNRAITSIKAGRPAIVGIGYYWHYPLAYGYAERKYKILGVTVRTSRYFRCNMGWGGNSPQWKSASSTWFGTNGHYW